MTRVQKALEELDYLEDIFSISEGKDFVEVVGGIGGDVSRYRVHFDDKGNVTFIGVK